jgi:hypothetical protein
VDLPDKRTAALALGGLVLGGFALSRLLSSGSRFGDVALSQARSDLGVTQSGDPSRVLQMLSTYGINSMANWCAAAVGTWIKQAAAVDSVAPPIPGSAGAKNTMEQFQDPGNSAVGWIDVADLTPGQIQPGMVVVWQRGPAGSWMGHIGIVSDNLGGGSFKSVEGNGGPTGGAVVESTHDLSSTALLGMGYFKDGGLHALLPGTHAVAVPPDVPQAFMPVAGVEPEPSNG